MAEKITLQKWKLKKKKNVPYRTNPDSTLHIFIV